MPIDFQKYKDSLTRSVDVDIDQLESILSAVAVKPPPLGGGYKATCTL